MVDFGRVDVPDPGEPTYRNWLPAPASLLDAGLGGNDFGNTDPEQSYPIQFTNVARVRGLGAAVPPAFDRHRNTGRAWLDHLGVGFENFQWVVRIGRSTTGVAIVRAAFDPDAVARTLVGTGYDRVGGHRGVRLFARGDDPRAIAVGDETLVWTNPRVGTRFGQGDADSRSGAPNGTASESAGTPSESGNWPGPGVDRESAARAALAPVRTVVDAGRGATPRFHETDRAFDRLTRITGAPPWAWFVTDPQYLTALGSSDAFDGMGGYSSTLSFGRSDAYWQSAYVFERPTDSGRVKRDVRERLPAYEQAQKADAVDVHVGQYDVRVAGVVDTDRYREVLAHSTQRQYPQVTLGFEHERRDGHTRVVVTHEAGDVVAAERLAVSARNRTLGQFSRRYDAVGPGDSLSVTLATDGATDPDEVRVIWQKPDAGHRIVLREYTVV